MERGPWREVHGERSVEKGPWREQLVSVMGINMLLTVGEGGNLSCTHVAVLYSIMISLPVQVI